MGNAYELDHNHLVKKKEAVTATDSDTQYTRDEDYKLSLIRGEIWILETGEMEVGETYEIDYEYDTGGTWPEDSEAPADARSDKQAIIGLGSNESASRRPTTSSSAPRTPSGRLLA